MTDNVLSVLTYKSRETMFSVGGSQSWVLDRDRALRCKYMVLCRNGRDARAEDDIPHGTAFMVGRIKEVVPSTNHDGRWLVLFSSYAECSAEGQWQGRNPVAYWTTDQYPDIDFAALDFKSMPPVGGQGPQAASGLTLQEAKEGLAKTFGVPTSAIEITVRG